MTRTELEAKCRRVKAVITDVDGVLTDGGMYYSESGDELKKFNVRDGVGVVLLKLAGIKVGAMTGEKTALVERRLLKIGGDFLYVGIEDKLACLGEIVRNLQVLPENVAYVGDEINDYALLGQVGLFLTVADANPLVKAKADHVLETRGGEGALREAAALILEAQGRIEEALEAYCVEHSGPVS